MVEASDYENQSRVNQGLINNLLDEQSQQNLKISRLNSGTNDLELISPHLVGSNQKK